MERGGPTALGHCAPHVLSRRRRAGRYARPSHAERRHAELGQLHRSGGHRRPAVVALVVAALLVSTAPAVPIQADESVEIEAQEVVQDLSGEQLVIDLPIDVASHVALHWPGQHEALVSVAFSTDGTTFGPALSVEHDEVGEYRDDG